MNGLFKRIEDCSALGAEFLSSEWIRNEYEDGSTEFVSSKEKGDCKIQITVINEAAAFIVTDVCFRENNRLRFMQMRGRLEFSCCLQGDAWLATPDGQRLVRRGDTVLLPVTDKRQPEWETLSVKAGERFVSAGFFILTGKGSQYMSLLEQEPIINAFQQLNREGYSLPGVVTIPSLQSALFKAYCRTSQNTLARILLLESSMLETVSYLMDWVLGEKESFKTLDDYDYRALRQVHDQMLTDLAHLPTLSQLAKEAGLNETKLKRGFKEVYGMPIYQYFKKAKLEKAMELLETTDSSVREISFQCGYSSQGQFSAAFRNQFGVAPLQARKIAKADNFGLGQKKTRLGDTLRN